MATPVYEPYTPDKRMMRLYHGSPGYVTVSRVYVGYGRRVTCNHRIAALAAAAAKARAQNSAIAGVTHHGHGHVIMLALPILIQLKEASVCVMIGSG